jgi:hypothetical protein
MLLPLLMAVAGCTTVAGPSAYKIQIPLLAAPPKPVPCALNGQPAECLLILKADFEALVREIKTACLGSGQTKAECQAE